MYEELLDEQLLPAEMRQFYKELLDEQLLPAEMWEVTCGSLYHGPLCLSRERWEFWKLDFPEVMDEVDEAAAKMALEAVSAMQRIEKGRI